MAKYCIMADKVGDFIVKMYGKGISVDTDPKQSQLIVRLPGNKYEWITVFSPSSFDDLCKAFDPESTNVDEQ